MRQKSKSTNDAEHFKQRLLERYGIKASHKMIMQIVEQINVHTYLRNTTNTRSYHLVSVKGQKVLVVWSFSRKLLVTCLGKDAYEWNELRREGLIHDDND